MLEYSKWLISSFEFLPPITQPIDYEWFENYFIKSVKTCIASSLVGVIINAPNPSKLDHWDLYNDSIIGIN